MPDIERVIDGDTVSTTEDNKLRVGYINTPESVHKNDDLNTPEGEQASEFAKDVLPEGSEIITHDYGKDHFGRQVGDVKRVINGVAIDYGFVALDQQLSSYYTKYGEHPDPLAHDQYKEYYSKDVPYQYGTSQEPLSNEVMQDINQKQINFQETYTKFKNGEATQEDLDAATVDLYKDPDLVKRYRHQINNWNRPTEQTNEYSVHGAMRRALDVDPSLKDVYNRAVRNGHLMNVPVPEEEPSFWEKTKTSFSMLNTVSNLADTEQLWATRQHGNNFEVPKDELVKGVPEKFHTLILEEADKYNDQAGLLVRDQLIEDIENNRIFDNMEWYAQLGYGAIAVLADPTTLAVGGAVAKGGMALNRSVRAYTTNRALRNTAYMAEWTTGGALEGSLINAPRLSGDHTYTARDYTLDIIFDAGLGATFGTLFATGAKGFDYIKAMRDARQKEQEEIQALAENGDEPIVKAVEVTEEAKVHTNENTAKVKVAEVTKQKFVPFESITEVSPDGFRLAVKTLNNTFPQGSTMRKLMNQQLGLINRLNRGNPKIEELPKIELDIQEDMIIFSSGGREVGATDNLIKDDVIYMSPDIEQGFGRASYLALAKQFPDKVVESSQDLSPFAESMWKKMYRDGLATRKQIGVFPGNNEPWYIYTTKPWDELNKSTIDASIVNKLSADILHIASAFPDGKIPKNVESAINEVMWKQTEFTRRNALANILAEGVSDVNKELDIYLRSLRNQEQLWEGYDVVPMSRGDFFAHQSDWLSVEGRANPDDLFNLTTALPKELSYLKDVIELNRLAAKRNDPEFTSMVEELNGMVAVRREQREFSDFRRYKDSSKSFGKTVPMTPPEIAAQLRKEGLKPTTPEYKSRLQELKNRGRAAVSKDVNELGRLDEYEVGTQRTEQIEGSEKYHSIDDAEKRMLELQKKPNPTKEDVDEFNSIEDFLAKAKQDKVTTLVKEDFEQDLLPRSVTHTESVNAYKDPTAANLETLRKRLDSNLIKKLKLREIKGKAEKRGQQERLEAVARALKSKKGETIARMVKAGKWQNLEDVIRVSHTLAEEAKATKASQPKPKEGEAAKEEPDVTPVTEEELAILEDGNLGLSAPQVSAENFAKIQAKTQDAYERMVQQAAQDTADEMAKFVNTGEKKAFELLRKPRGVLDYVGRIAAKLTEDLGTKFQNGKLTSLEYIGSRLTEIGKGYGGAGRRKATAGLIKDAKYRESVMQIIPQYAAIMDKYAANKGRTAFGRMRAQQEAGADNKLVEQFNREVFTVQEYRRQGKPLPSNIDKSVLEFVDQWNKYMEYNHSELVNAGIGGFTKDKKISNYIPHIWKPANLEAAINKHGEAKVKELLRRAYQSAQQAGTNPHVRDPLEMAERQIDWVREQGKVWDKEAPQDQFLPVKDSRAKQRQDLDTTIEVDGLSVLDLLESDIVTLATKYSQRMSGWVALSKATDGLITSELNIKTLKQNMVAEGKDKGVDTKKYEQYYDDLINLMFGRPTRGGLAQEFRELKDLTALTRMGGLGTAQLIESGQVITRSVLNTFSDPKVAQKHIKAGLTEGTDERTLLREMQALTNLTDDVEWLDRQSVHLDQAELAKVNKARQLSLWVANKATGGNRVKASASRLLGKTSGYNAIRRAQSRVTQMSFMLDVAKHFHNKSGKMGNARMADLGLTDKDGVDVDLQEAFDKHVEFKDGLPVKMNFGKWSIEAREKFQFAALRDEAQQIQRTLVGELPPWMNRPMMSLIFQFRQMPLVATNKQLARSMAFADKEAVMNIMLNTAMAGLIRYSKFALLGLAVSQITGNEAQDPNTGQMQMDKYITQLGIFADAYDLGLQASQVESAGDVKDTTMRQIPMLGLMNDYYQMGNTESTRKQIQAAQGLTPLGNTAYGDLIHATIQELNNGD